MEQISAHVQSVSQLVSMETQTSAMASSQANTSIPGSGPHLRGGVEAEHTAAVSNESNSGIQTTNEPRLIFSENTNEPKPLDFSPEVMTTEQLVAMSTQGKVEVEDVVTESRAVMAESGKSLNTVPQQVNSTLILSDQIQQRSLDYSQEKQDTDTSNEATSFINSESLQQSLQATFQQHSREQQKLTDTNYAAGQEQMGTAGSPELVN